MKKALNIIFPINDFLYVLQLEEYAILRYLKKVTKVLFKRNFQVRDTLKNTPRVKLTIIITVFCLSLLFAVLVSAVHILGAVIGLISLPFITPFIIAFSSLLVGIPSFIIKKQRLRIAANYFRASYPKTKVIGITGSFGKTTTKYLLHHVLQYDFKTAIIPDNINTGIGIANYVLSGTIPKDTEYLIVEMAAYTRGDIAESTRTLKPDIAILTVLGDQHMERFGSFENLVTGKAEIFTTQNNTCFTTESAAKILKEHQVSTDTLVTVPDSDDSHLLVEKVAVDLGITKSSINASFESFKSPSRRNEFYTKGSVLVIDNSYNISPMIAEKMLKNARRTADNYNKELVVMTGGIGEQAPRNREVNNAFGALLNTYANKVILNPTIFAPSILETLEIPHVTAEDNRDVINNIEKFVNGDSEILLYLTGQTDLEYI